MKVYIIKENGYEDRESIIKGVYQRLYDAQDAISDLRNNVDEDDKDWLFYTLEEAKVID